MKLLDLAHKIEDILIGQDEGQAMYDTYDVWVDDVDFSDTQRSFEDVEENGISIFIGDEPISFAISRYIANFKFQIQLKVKIDDLKETYILDESEVLPKVEELVKTNLLRK